MKKIGFIGFGNMAQAIISGLISSGNFLPDEIGVYDTDKEKIKIATPATHSFSKCVNPKSQVNIIRNHRQQVRFA